MDVDCFDVVFPVHFADVFDCLLLLEVLNYFCCVVHIDADGAIRQLVPYSIL